MLLPFYLSTLLEGVIASYTVRTLIEGVIRVGIFLLYIWLISMMEDIAGCLCITGRSIKPSTAWNTAKI